MVKRRRGPSRCRDGFIGGNDSCLGRANIPPLVDSMRGRANRSRSEEVTSTRFPLEDRPAQAAGRVDIEQYMDSLRLKTERALVLVQPDKRPAVPCSRSFLNTDAKEVMLA